ncbi:hypothetical protein L218DRAFT_558279 [Marasmius fiardii PR-910]|nr:hypothetical protein L218DRAFT_558279 [Marasmius fiardii PR-910]
MGGESYNNGGWGVEKGFVGNPYLFGPCWFNKRTPPLRTLPSHSTRMSQLPRGRALNQSYREKCVLDPGSAPTDKRTEK